MKTVRVGKNKQYNLELTLDGVVLIRFQLHSKVSIMLLSTFVNIFLGLSVFTH